MNQNILAPSHVLKMNQNNWPQAFTIWEASSGLWWEETILALSIFYLFLLRKQKENINILISHQPVKHVKNILCR